MDSARFELFSSARDGDFQLEAKLNENKPCNLNSARCLFPPDYQVPVMRQRLLSVGPSVPGLRKNK